MTTPGNEVSLRYANWALLEEHLLKFNIGLPRKEIVFICGGGAHASQPPCSAGLRTDPHARCRRCGGAADPQRAALPHSCACRTPRSHAASLGAGA